MQRLADVELRLIMHNVDAQSLLRFARCSRLLLHAADARHTWKHTPISLSSEAFTGQRLQVFNPLIRHAPVTLKVAASKRAFSVEDMLLTLARAQVRLFEFDASHSNKISAKQWRMLLAHRACRQLRVIRMNYSFPVLMDREFWQSFAALPHLHTALLCPMNDPDSTVWSTWQLGNLTSLGFTTTAFVGFHELCGPLERTRLQRLELHGPLYNSAVVEKYFRSEAAIGLQELRIEVAQSSNLPESTRAAMFSPPHLRIVELIGVGQVSEWITELKHAQSLQMLRFAPVSIPFQVSEFWLRQNMPPVSLLLDLLTQLPELHCEMRFSFKSTSSVIVLECAETLNKHVAPITDAFPSRLTMKFGPRAGLL